MRRVNAIVKLPFALLGSLGRVWPTAFRLRHLQNVNSVPPLSPWSVATAIIAIIMVCISQCGQRASGILASHVYPPPALGVLGPRRKG